MRLQHPQEGPKEGSGAAHAVSAYYKPASSNQLTLGPVVIPMRQGILATVLEVDKLPADQVRLAARELGASTHSLERLRDLLKARLQVEWYAVRGAVPASITARLESTITAINQQPIMTDESTTPPAAPTEGKGRGARALARELITAGETDDEKILAAVKEKFPNVAFKLADVRWQRKHGGNK